MIRPFSKKANYVLFVVLVCGALGFISYSIFSEKPSDDAYTPQDNSLKTDSGHVENNEADFVEFDSFGYIKDDKLFSVSKEEFRISERFTVAELVKESKECEINKDGSYFEKILSNYSTDDKGIEYHFQYNKGKSQDSGVWKVTIVPNKIGYENLDGFKSDFGLCRAGADMYPTLVSDRWLLFESSCGTGFDDGSGNPHGCEVVRQAVAPTIELE